jgi:Ca2+-binding RTX toxin-like protein
VLAYSLSGIDAALFKINASTGAVTFKASPDFEMPKDADANNIYDITVQASDGSLTASRNVQISVIDVNDVLIGSSSRDFLSGGSTGSGFFGAGGDDVIVGGAGTDTAYYTGRYNNYSIATNSNGSTTVLDLRAGSPEGTDTLTNIEKLSFLDATTKLEAQVSNAINVFSPFTAVVGSAGGGELNATNSFMFRPALSNW